jgi:hypothetical protein
MTHQKRIEAGDATALEIEDKKKLFWAAVEMSTKYVENTYKLLVNSVNELADHFEEDRDKMFMRTIPAPNTPSPGAGAQIRFWVENQKDELNANFEQMWYRHFRKGRCEAMRRHMQNNNISVLEAEEILAEMAAESGKEEGKSP